MLVYARREYVARCAADTCNARSGNVEQHVIGLHHDSVETRRLLVIDESETMLGEMAIANVLAPYQSNAIFLVSCLSS